MWFAGSVCCPANPSSPPLLGKGTAGIAAGRGMHIPSGVHRQPHGYRLFGITPVSAGWLFFKLGDPRAEQQCGVMPSFQKLLPDGEGK